MSHILDNKVDFSSLKKVVEGASTKSIDVATIENDLEIIIPKDTNGKKLVSSDIRENGFITAAYIPEGNYLKMASNKVEAWVQNNINNLKENFFIKNVELFRGYIYLYLLAHEVEHSYQKQIALGKINVNNSIVQGAYYHIFRQLKKENSLFPRHISEIKKLIAKTNYRKKENEYVLERNASLEGYDLAYRLANHYQNAEMIRAFYCLRCFICKLGYKSSTEGSFSETYRAMLMQDKFDKIIANDTLDAEEVVRYGLPVTEETRQKVLSL